MTKAELQDKVDELELTLNSLELNANTVKDDLRIVTTQLEAVNKVKITKDIVNDIRDVIEQSIRRAVLVAWIAMMLISKLTTTIH